MTDQSGYPGAPPGWYPDPAGGPGQRWWDGYAWTESTVLPHRPPPPPWAGAGPPQGPPSEIAPWAEASQRLAVHNTATLVNEEQRTAPIARIALLIPPIYFLVTLISNRINASQLLYSGHQLRIDWDDAQNGVAPPQAHPVSFGSSPLVLFLMLATVGAIVMACIWQHRAASAGRSLGIPSHQSPGWGVGAWFVPIANLWVPYLAIRDCLPPTDPRRARVLHWWIALLCAGWLTLGAWIASLFSSGAAFVLTVPAALACLAVVAWAPGIVTGIAAAHGDALAQTHKAEAFSL